MKNNKLVTSILCVSLLGGSLLAVGLSRNSYKVTAEECTHSNVVHYDGVSPTSGTGYVEHWACCECHSAWADEARTTKIGNTETDRSKIDIFGIYLTVNHEPVGQDMQWTLPMEPVYDKGIDSTAYVFSGIDSVKEFWVETQGASELPAQHIVKMSFFNDTDHDLKLRLRSRQWNKADSQISFPRRAWAQVSIGQDYWNFDDLKGVAFDMVDRNGAEFKGGIRVTAPVIEEAIPEPYVCFDTEGHTMSYGNANWYAATKTTDPVKGNVFEIDYNGADIITTNGGSLRVDPILYSGVEFYVYNGTAGDFTMYSTADWGVNTQYGSLAHGEWTRCFIPTVEWNKGVTTYFYTQGAGEGTVLFTYFTTVVADAYK